jgi:hypothetical protein
MERLHFNAFCFFKGIEIERNIFKEAEYFQILTLKRNSYFFYLWNIFEEKFLEKKN